MNLLGWNMSDGTVSIHRKGCTHRKPNRRPSARGVNAQDQIEFGEQDWLSKEAFCYDYWANGILQEYESEHGDGTFDVFQGMNFANCCDDLPEREPKPEPAKGKKSKAKTERVVGHRAWATKPITPAMIKFTAWIAREFADIFPDLDPSSDTDMRLVMIASKAYSHFQSSDMNPKDGEQPAPEPAKSEPAKSAPAARKAPASKAVAKKEPAKPEPAPARTRRSKAAA